MKKSTYVCVSCGAPSSALYKQQGAGILKLLRCSHCGQITDKYVEYDPTIIFIDIVLQQKSAFRHILFNAGHSKVFWKLSIIFVLCDTYMLWSRKQELEGKRNFDSDLPPQPPQIEWDFYVLCFMTILETLVYSGMVLTVTGLLHHCLQMGPMASPQALMKAVVVGNGGKLLAIPALVWGQSNSSVYLTLTAIFIWLSQARAYESVCDVRRSLAMIVATVALSSQLLIRWSLLSLV